MVEFSQDENTVTLNGRRYVVTTPPEDGSCGYCAFKKEFGCRLCDAVYTQEGLYSKKVSRCCRSQREDGKSINWVLPK